jgi:hypothetical protein
MKTAFLLALMLIVNAASYAADTKPVEEVFNRYWSAYSKKNLAKAAEDILPEDMENLKKEILPVFLANQSPKEKEAQDIVALFFERRVGQQRANMTPADVYAGLNRIVMASNAQMFDVLKDATISIIFVRSTGPDDAEIHFQVTLRGESDTDAESLSKKNGRWWIRLKDDPKETAAQFKQILTGAMPPPAGK